jgi:hypothetical protein
MPRRTAVPNEILVACVEIVPKAGAIRWNSKQNRAIPRLDPSREDRLRQRAPGFVAGRSSTHRVFAN